MAIFENGCYERAIMIERGDGVVGCGGVGVCVCKKKPLPPFSCNQDVGSTTAPHSGFLVPQILDNLTRIITKVTMTNMITMMTIMMTYLLVVLIRKWVSSPTM